jgi:hypothetical protein
MPKKENLNLFLYEMYVGIDQIDKVLIIKLTYLLRWSFSPCPSLDRVEEFPVFGSIQRFSLPIRESKLCAIFVDGIFPRGFRSPTRPFPVIEISMKCSLYWKVFITFRYLSSP